MLNKDWNMAQGEGEKDFTKNREDTPSSQKPVTSARGTSSSSDSICHYHSSDAEPDEDADLISWTDDIDAKQELFSVFTCFYALILIIIGLVLELSHLLNDGVESTRVGQARDMIFSIYMYGGSLIFFSYCYTVLLNSRMSRSILKGVRRATERTLKLDGAFNNEGKPIVKTVAMPSPSSSRKIRASRFHGQASTGSLYLRLGCVVFGIFGVVFYGLIILVCILQWGTERSDCNIYGLIMSLFATLFVFVQMHFIFCNSKIRVHGSLKLARLGMMHLVATNLWTWMRYILLEEQATTAELQHANFASKSLTPYGRMNQSPPELVASEHHEAPHGEICRGANCVLGSFTEFMYTCVVEYALICAGISFVFWTNVGKGPSEYQKQKKRKTNVIAIDCSRTTTGLFLGFAIIAFTFICIAVFNAYIYKHDSEMLANTIFFSTDGILLLCSLVAIVFAFFRMRKLNYKKKEGDVDESAELLDRILLFFGLVGELLFSIGGIMSLSNTDDFNYMIIILIVVQYTRLFQVVLQSALLLIGSKLKAATPEMKMMKPGKQVITFLLIVNIAMFIMNTFEAQKAGVTEDIVRYYGSRAWALLVRGCAPLTIFYRFHSSACFAEIWKHTYKAATIDLELI